MWAGDCARGELELSVEGEQWNATKRGSRRCGGEEGAQVFLTCHTVGGLQLCMCGSCMRRRSLTPLPLNSMVGEHPLDNRKRRSNFAGVSTPGVGYASAVISKPPSKLDFGFKL